MRSPRVAGFILVFVARHRVNCKNKTKVATVSKYLGLLINDAISRNTQQRLRNKRKRCYSGTKVLFSTRENKREILFPAKSGKTASLVRTNLQGDPGN